jgi:hypothetical protein
MQLSTYQYGAIVIWPNELMAHGCLLMHYYCYKIIYFLEMTKSFSSISANFVPPGIHIIKLGCRYLRGKEHFAIYVSGLIILMFELKN